MRTIKRAAPLAMVSVTLVYMLVNVAYYAVVDKAEILESGRIAAALYFGKLWGVNAERVRIPSETRVCAQNSDNYRGSDRLLVLSSPYRHWETFSLCFLLTDEVRRHCRRVQTLKMTCYSSCSRARKRRGSSLLSPFREQ